jgi:hypothetical protein
MALPASELSSVSTDHPSEDAMDEYVMGRMPATGQVQLEEHVLICPSCCASLAETFRFVKGIKSAMREIGGRNGRPPTSHHAEDIYHPPSEGRSQCTR